MLAKKRTKTYFKTSKHESKLTFVHNPILFVNKLKTFIH